MSSLHRLRTLVELGRFDAVLRMALTLPSEGDPALRLFQHGAEALKRRDAFTAVAAFESVAVCDPDFPALGDALATAYRRDARYEDCLRVASGYRQRNYEQALSLLALGDSTRALDAFDRLLAQDDQHAASWFASHAPALELKGTKAARERLDRAVTCVGANGRYLAMIAAYALLHQEEDASSLIERHIRPFPARRALVEGVVALLPWMSPERRVFGVSASVLRFAMAHAPSTGLVLEFGVRRGTSLRCLAALTEQTVHGFDSFEGLPEAWGDHPPGLLTTGRALPTVPGHVTLQVGWFAETLPRFLGENPTEKVRLVNIDSDLYPSAQTVLQHLAPRIHPGTILVFDEFIGNRDWENGEYRAFQDYITCNPAPWEIIAIAPMTKQVVIRIL